jgi:hypothetical protein
LPPFKSGNTSPLTEGRKDVVGTTTRTLQRVTYSAYPSSGTLLELQEETNLKTPTTGAQVINTITKNNSRCVNINAE